MDYLQVWDDGTITIAQWNLKKARKDFIYVSDPSFDPADHESIWSIPLADFAGLVSKVCAEPEKPTIFEEIERLWKADKSRVYVIKFIREQERIGLKEAVDVCKEWEKYYCARNGYQEVQWGTLAY